MAERSSSKIKWEQDYLEKVNYISEIASSEVEGVQNRKVLAAASTSAVTGISSTDPDFIGPLQTDVVTATVDLSSITLPKNMKPAYLTGNTVTIPTGGRKDYHKARIMAARQSNFAGFVPISTEQFYFVHPKQNTFAADFANILPLLYQVIAPKIGVKKIQVNSGFRHDPVQSQWSPHMCGIAIDIGSTGQERYTIADAAWSLGLRGVAIGKSFVHIDCGPDPISGWSYPGVAKYRGPSSH